MLTQIPLNAGGYSPMTPVILAILGPEENPEARL